MVFGQIQIAADTQTMLRSADELLVISSEHGFDGHAEVGSMIQGWCLGTVGRAAKSIPLLLQGVTSRRARGAALLLPLYLTMLAEIYGMAGQPNEGLKRLAEAANLVQTTQERWAEAELHRLRGTLLLSLHKLAEAEQSYCKAFTVARG
jgi:predicted ATPase